MAKTVENQLWVRARRSRRCLQVGAVSCLLMILGVAVWLRLPGLDPSCLWFDDCWQAVLANQPLPIQFQWRSSESFGFTWLLSAFAWASDDPEIRYQLLPLFCSLAMVPAAYWVYPRSRNSKATALLFAAMMALGPMLVTYATRVKQFTLDALLVMCVLGFSLRLRRLTQQLPWFALFALVLLPLSYCSNILATIVLNVGIGSFLVRRAGKTKGTTAKLVLLWISYHSIVCLYYVLVLASQRSGRLAGYWSDFYVDSIREVVARLGMLFYRSLPWHILGNGWLQVVLVVVPFVFFMLGMARLLLAKGRRIVGVSVCLFYLALVVLSALGLYPLGAGRTDIFTHPVTLFLIVFGVGVRAPGWVFRPKGQACCIAMVGLIALGWGIYMHKFYTWYYPDRGDTVEMAAILRAHYQDGDHVLIYPHGCFSFAYYTHRQCTFAPTPAFGNGFELRPVAENMHLLPGPVGFQKDPAILNQHLADTLKAHPPRLLLWATYSKQPALRHIQLCIEQAGYRPQVLFTDQRASLTKYIRIDDLTR